MKVLKALLAVLTALAVALTAALLFIQDKNASSLKTTQNTVSV